MSRKPLNAHFSADEVGWLTLTVIATREQLAAGHIQCVTVDGWSVWLCETRTTASANQLVIGWREIYARFPIEQYDEAQEAWVRLRNHVATEKMMQAFGLST